MPTDQIISFQEIVLESLTQPIYAVDLKHRIVLWNKAIAEITGITSSAAIGTEIDEIFSFDNIELRSALEDEEKFTAFVRVNHLEFRTLVEPMVLDGVNMGSRGELFIVDDDVLTTLPREYLVDVINESPISTIVFNLDGGIMFSNSAYRKMWRLDDAGTVSRWPRRRGAGGSRRSPAGAPP